MKEPFTISFRCTPEYYQRMNAALRRAKQAAPNEHLDLSVLAALGSPELLYSLEENIVPKLERAAQRRAARKQGRPRRETL